MNDRVVSGLYYFYFKTEFLCRLNKVFFLMPRVFLDLLLSLQLLKMGWDSSALRMESLTLLQISKPISVLKPQQTIKIKGLREIYLRHLWGKSKTSSLGIIQNIKFVRIKLPPNTRKPGSSLTIPWVGPLSSLETQRHKLIWEWVKVMSDSPSQISLARPIG